MTTLELIQYYTNILIIQYSSLIKASETVSTDASAILMPQAFQRITFTPAPTSGTFSLIYNGTPTGLLNWNDTALTVQTALRLNPVLSNVSVQGSIATKLNVFFTNVIESEIIIIQATNTLLSGINPVVILSAQSDKILPLAIQDAFNVDTSVGVQLDTIGKYAGVVRDIFTEDGSISLNDTDFRTFVKFAIVGNTAGSSMLNIEQNMDIFFSGQFLIFDYQNMNMSYILSSNLGSVDLFTALVQENRLPRPMAVGASVIIAEDVRSFFGFSTYKYHNITLAKPFNRYTAFDPTAHFLSYANGFFV